MRLSLAPLLLLSSARIAAVRAQAVNLAPGGSADSSGTCGGKYGAGKAIDGIANTYAKMCDAVGNYWAVTLDADAGPATIEEICIAPVFNKKGTKVKFKLEKAVLRVEGLDSNANALSWETPIPKHGNDDPRLCFPVDGIEGSIETRVSLTQKPNKEKGIQVAEVEVWGGNGVQTPPPTPAPTPAPTSTASQTLKPTEDAREVVNAALTGHASSPDNAIGNAGPGAAIDDDPTTAVHLEPIDGDGSVASWRVTLPETLDIVAEEICVYVPDEGLEFADTASVVVPSADPDSVEDLRMVLGAMDRRGDSGYCWDIVKTEGGGIYGVSSVVVENRGPLHLSEVQVLAKDMGACPAARRDAIVAQDARFLQITDPGISSSGDGACGSNNNVTAPPYNATDLKQMSVWLSESPDRERGGDDEWYDPCTRLRQSVEEDQDPTTPAPTSTPTSRPTLPPTRGTRPTGQVANPPRDSSRMMRGTSGGEEAGSDETRSEEEPTTTTTTTTTTTSDGHDDDSDRRKLQGTVNVLFWKVRKCNGWLCLFSSLTKSEFHHWPDNNVNRGTQKNTYIANLREPARSSVKRLVLTISGSGDLGDWISGSTTGWRWGWPKTQSARHVPYAIGSWSQVYQNLFHDGETFVASTYGPGYEYYQNRWEKQDVEDAYFDWLLSKTYTGNLKEVILAGAHDGGCLALRLGERFNRVFGNAIDVAIMAADANCRPSQNEFGITGLTTPNPSPGLVGVWPQWRGYETNMYSEFSKEGRSLYIQNYVSGQRPWDDIRGLSDDLREAQPVEFQLGGGWYNQQWITAGANDADYWATFVPTGGPINFWNRALDWFDGDCANPCPHGGWYDSVHCYVGTPPAGTTPFIWAGNYYYTPIGASWCPMPGSWYDGANCYVGTAPATLDPFIWSGNWYYQPDWSDGPHCNPPYWTQWLDRDNPNGTGDWELLSHYNPHPCGGDTPVDIQCEAWIPWLGISFPASLTGEIFTCDPTVGLICRDIDQLDGNCDWDYRVRFLCP